MKQGEILIGGTYVTRVSGARVRVIVTAKIEGKRWNGRAFVEYAVKREGNDRPLSNRSAAALHPAPARKPAEKKDGST